MMEPALRLVSTASLAQTRPQVSLVPEADDALLDTVPEAFARAMARLPADQRAAVFLAYYHGLDLREIGEVIGVTEARACQLRAGGLRTLKSWFERSV